MGPRGPFTRQEALEALNFTLPPTVVAVLLNIVAIIANVVSPGSGTIFAMLALLVLAVLTVWSVIAAVKVNKGNPYRYSANLRLIKPRV